MDRTRLEQIFLVVLCVFAAGRVFVFSAAFPFFNNVDEQMHFDLVYKYSVGDVPKEEIANYNRKAAELILLYGTPEYFYGTANIPDGSIPSPNWKIPNVRSAKDFDIAVSRWQQQGNHESASFPAYYAIAGLWAAAGRCAGLTGGYFLYWIRFLNIPIVTALVYFSYLIGRTFAASNPVQRFGLPALTACFPQDVFYSINSDVLSPLLFAISLFMLLQLYFRKKSLLFHSLAGLSVAGCFLVKVSNLAVLVLLGLIVILKVKQLLAKSSLSVYLPRLLALILMSFVPIGLWLMRNYLQFGDITGSAHKAEFLGWTVKPLGEIWNHPIFSISGFSYFIQVIAFTFWRGEFVWHLEQIGSPWMDNFYIYSSAIFLGTCLIALTLKRKDMSKEYRFLLTVSFLTVATSVLLLAALSIAFDFGNCYAPSRELPYFTSGRLILCSLLPFLLLYTDGLGRLFSRWKYPTIPFIVLCLIVIVITISEWMITRQVFLSPYNWYHLRG